MTLIEIQFAAGQEAQARSETAAAALMRSQLPHADAEALPLIKAWLDGWNVGAGVRH